MKKQRNSKLVSWSKDARATGSKRTRNVFFYCAGEALVCLADSELTCIIDLSRWRRSLEVLLVCVLACFLGNRVSGGSGFHWICPDVLSPFAGLAGLRVCSFSEKS